MGSFVNLFFQSRCNLNSEHSQVADKNQVSRISRNGTTFLRKEIEEINLSGFHLPRGSRLFQVFMYRTSLDKDRATSFNQLENACRRNSITSWIDTEYKTTF